MGGLQESDSSSTHGEKLHVIASCCNFVLNSTGPGPVLAVVRQTEASRLVTLTQRTPGERGDMRQRTRGCAPAQSLHSVSCIEMDDARWLMPADVLIRPLANLLSGNSDVPRQLH